MLHSAIEMIEFVFKSTVSYLVESVVVVALYALVPATYFILGLAQPGISSFIFARLIASFIVLGSVKGLQQAERRSNSLGDLVRFVCQAYTAILIPVLIATILYAVTLHSTAMPELLQHGLPLGVSLALLSGLWAWFFPTRSHEEEHLRGSKLVSQEEAIKKSDEARGDEPGIVFGRLRLPLRVALKGFLCIGSPGSGKTLTIRMFMESVLPAVSKKPDFRALILDVKGDLLSLLSGMPGVDMDSVRTLNPFDRRCSPWDMQTDFCSQKITKEMAEILIPRSDRSDPYWTDAPRELLAGVFDTFRRTVKNWELRDVVLTFRRPNRLRAVLSITRDGRDLIASHFEPDNTFKNIFSTARTYIDKLGPVASCWYHAPREKRISLKDWLDPSTPDYMLVLRADASVGGAGLTAINRILFTRLVQLILSDPTEVDTPRTFFILDEANELGQLGNAGIELCTKGRSKGACTFLAFQNILAFQKALGEKDGLVLGSLATNKFLLRTEDADTAKWAEEAMGRTEVRRPKWSQTRGTSAGGSTESSTISDEQTQTPVVMAAEFQNLPEASIEEGFCGYLRTPLTGLFKARMTPAYIKQKLHPANRSVDAFQERDHTDEELEPWSEEDLIRLGLPLSLLNEDDEVNEGAEPEGTSDDDGPEDFFKGIGKPVH